MTHDYNIIIDEEFQNLLPPLPKEACEELEYSIIAEGCRDAIVLWNGVIVDGHNRYEVCKTHRLPFKTTEKSFSSRDEAKMWIISTQLCRRQLSRKETAYYRGVQYNLAKSAQGGTGANQYTAERTGQNVQSGDTSAAAQRIGEQYSVTGRTIRRDAETASVIDKIGAVSPEARKKILSGESAISQKELGKLRKAPDAEISSVAEQIASGAYIEDKPGFRVPEGWDMPEPIRRKKQTWCAFISAGIDALDSVIGNIDKDLANKLPLVETQDERDFLRDKGRSYIDRLTAVIDRI